MKICWFDDNKLGVVVGDEVRDVSAALRVLPPAAYPGPLGDRLITHLDAVRAEIGTLVEGAAGKPVSQARFLSPVNQPSKIIGVPVNFLKHVEEVDADRGTFADTYRGSIENQGLFLKSCSSLVGPSAGVTLRFPSRRTDHEIELGLVIGRRASHVSEDNALSYVAGYALALDMVLRGPEDRSFRKSPDSYSVLGPWLTTADEILDPQALEMSLRVNGELRQRSNTRLMIMSLKRQIAWASSLYTLLPGDIIMTGTCEGVGPVVPGDVMECEIERLGRMDVGVHAGQP